MLSNFLKKAIVSAVSEINPVWVFGCFEKLDFSRQPFVVPGAEK